MMSPFEDPGFWSAQRSYENEEGISSDSHSERPYEEEEKE